MSYPIIVIKESSTEIEVWENEKEYFTITRPEAFKVKGAHWDTRRKPNTPTPTPPPQPFPGRRPFGCPADHEIMIESG